MAYPEVETAQTFGMIHLTFLKFSYNETKNSIIFAALRGIPNLGRQRRYF